MRIRPGCLSSAVWCRCLDHHRRPALREGAVLVHNDSVLTPLTRISQEWIGWHQ